MRHDLRRLEGRVISAQSEGAEPAISTPVSMNGWLAVPGADIAVWWLGARRLRESVFGVEVFKDLDWAIMLDLYGTGAAGKKIQITDVPIMTGLKRTTARRHLYLLEEAGWVSRAEDPKDRRRTLVGLTERGWDIMTLYFGELVAKMNWPPLSQK